VLFNTICVISGRPQLFGTSSAAASASAQSTFGAFGGGGGGTGGGSNNCQTQEVSPGRFKVLCGTSGPTVSSEHILWLTQNGGQPQVVDIEVPNYKILELIKAGFKTGAAGGSTINVLLKRPETSVDAQVDVPSVAGGPPKVNLQYEPVQPTLIHFPNDKQYSTLQGPIEPPLARGPPAPETNLDVRFG